MLEKYLNKEVIIEEKLFHYPSTLHSVLPADVERNKIEGTITAIDDEFIELDNTSIIARKFIYRITLK